MKAWLKWGLIGAVILYPIIYLIFFGFIGLFFCWEKSRGFCSLVDIIGDPLDSIFPREIPTGFDIFSRETWRLIVTGIVYSPLGFLIGAIIGKLKSKKQLQQLNQASVIQNQ